MPEAAAQDTSTPSPAIADLAGPDDKSMSGLVSSLTNLQRQKVATDTKISNQSDAEQAKDKSQRDHAFAQEGVAASEIPKPWDADKEHKKWESNPIEGFGSAGGLFAMVASAFTKAPMENAINGMAGAINSIKEGNEAGYARAYDAFKTNVKLADQRFKTQHELYSDALSLGTADAAASSAKLHNAAVKFGDSQVLMLAEHGMIKEIYELQAARASSHEQMIKAAEATDLHTIQKAAVDAIKKNPPQTGDPVQDAMQAAAMIHNVYSGTTEKYGTAENEGTGKIVQQAQREHWPVQKTLDALAEWHQQNSARMTDPKVQAYNDQVQAWQDSHPGETMPEDVQHQILERTGNLGRAGAGGTGNSSQANKTKAIEEIMAKEPGLTRAEAERKYKQTIRIPTAHDTHQDDVQYAKAERMEHTMDQMDELLLKHKALTGIGGTLTRPVEAISNILGSNETDRKQFQRFATELKEWGQSVVNDRSGRPLSSEAKDAAVIFAGLNPGDTSANTIRAIVELRPVIKKIKEDIKARGKGQGPVSGTGEPPAATPAVEPKGKDAPWLNDPVKP